MSEILENKKIKPNDCPVYVRSGKPEIMVSLLLFDMGLKIPVIE
jgi:hypothetical protein